MPPLNTAESRVDFVLDRQQQLIDSHEDRVQRMEVSITELVQQSAVQGSRLDSLIEKMNGFVDAIMSRSKTDENTALRLHDLEQDKKARDNSGKTRNWIFGTVWAGVIVDLVVNLIQHFHFVAR